MLKKAWDLYRVYKTRFSCRKQRWAIAVKETLRFFKAAQSGWVKYIVERGNKILVNEVKIEKVLVPRWEPYYRNDCFYFVNNNQVVQIENCLII